MADLSFLRKWLMRRLGEADSDRAKALGVAAGMTFTPAILYIAIIVLGGVVVLSRNR